MSKETMGWRSRVFCKLVRFLVLAQHVLLTVHFLVVSLLHYLAQDVDALVLNGRYMKVSAILYLTVALLNLYSVVRPWCSLNLCVRRFTTRITPFKQDKLFSAYLSTNTYISFSHSIEIMCETYFAYIMAKTIVQQHVSFLYSILLSINCLVTPWLFLLKDSRVKIILVDCVDCLMSFLLCALFPLVYFAVPLLKYKFFGNGFEVNDYTWFIQFIPPAKVLVTSSVLHLFAVIAPNVSMWITLRQISKNVNLIVTNRRFHSTAQKTPTVAHIHLAEKSIRSINNMTRKTSILHRIIGLYTIWGFVVLITTTYSTYHDKNCPPGCISASAPWFQSSCNCLYFRLNCIDQLIVNSTFVDQYILSDELGTDLSCLHVQECDIPLGLKGTTLTQFPNLYALRLEMTKLTDWNISSDYLPTSLIRLEIRYSRLNHIPLIFQSIGSHVKWLYFVGSNISTIPDKIVGSWQSLLSLWLSEGNFTTVPQIVQDLPHLSTLAMDRNKLSELPANFLEKFNALYWLYLGSNNLTGIPPDMINTNTLVYMSENPIQSISSQVITNVDLAGTPFCNRSQLGCYTPCAPGCSQMLLENYLCDLPCNTSECNFDTRACILH